MGFNIFSTLNQNLQNFGGDVYDAYQTGKSKVGNVASTINNNLQDFGGDIYDVGSTIKKNVSDFGTNTFNQGKNVASTIKKNVGDYATQQINEIKAIPSQIGQGVDNFNKGVRDANYNMWNSGLKSFTGKNNSTLTEAFPNAYNELSKNTGKADEDKVMKFVEEIAKAGYDQDQAMEILQTTLAEQPDFFNKKTPFDRVRQTAANRGREFGKTYEDFSTGKIGFGEATLRNAGDIIATPFGVMGDAAMSIPGVETAVGKVGEVVTSIPGVKPGMEAYSKFSEANPRAAQNIEAFTNLGLSALGSTQGQALMKQGTKAVGRKVAQGADYLDNVTSPLTTPIGNAISKGGEKIKSILAPINPDEQILKASGLKTVQGKIGDQVVDIPSYGVVEKGRSIIAPKDTQVLAGRALSPRGAGLTDKQKLASVANAEKNVRQYHSLVRTGKLKGDLTDLQTTAQSVVDNIDEVGAKIGDAVKKVNARVEIADDSYKAISDAIKAKGASRTPTAKILQNFVEDTSDGLTLQEAFDIKKIYQAEIKKLIASKDAGTPQYSALVKGVDDLSNQIDTAIETQLKGAKFKNLKSQYKLLKSMVGDITNSAMVEGRRAPQTFTEQLGTIQAMGDFITSPLATGRQFLAKEIGEMNTRGGSWRELVKRLDNEAVSAYKKSQTTAGKVMQREIDNLPVATKPPTVSKAKPKATKPPTVSKAKPKATTESALKTTPIVPEKKSIVAKKEVSTIPITDVKKEPKFIRNGGLTDDNGIYKDHRYKNEVYKKEFIANSDIEGTVIKKGDRVAISEESGSKGKRYVAILQKGVKDENGFYITSEPNIKLSNFYKDSSTPKESAFKNNKGFINPSEIKKSLVPKKGADEAKQFYDDLVYAGNSPIVAQRETAKRFGTIRAMSASKAGTMDMSKAPEALKSNTIVDLENPIVNEQTGETLNQAIEKLRKNNWSEKDISKFRESALGKKENIIKKEGVLDTVNPTGGLFVDYTPSKRSNSIISSKDLTTLDKTLGKSPDDYITIYRGTVKGQKEMNPGDFVTDLPDLAKSYAGGDKIVISKKVRYSDVIDSIDDGGANEYLYIPKEMQKWDMETKATNKTKVVPKVVESKAGTMELPEALVQEAKKYKSADEFVNSHLFHGSPNKIEGGELKYGMKKGQDSGGIFLTDSGDVANVFTFGKGTISYISPSIKNKVIDLTTPEGKNIVKSFIGKKYKTLDGDILEFSEYDFDMMFPSGKTDFASVSMFPEVISKIIKDNKKIGIAFNEYAGGKVGKTYQILEGNIPVKTESQLKQIYEQANKPKATNKK